jgi:hypothetical protein
VKDIEQTGREILTTLQKIHHEGGMKESKFFFIEWYNLLISVFIINTVTSHFAWDLRLMCD